MRTFPSKFIQIHTLTSYPFSCLNRDNNNTPKMGELGGKSRGRISSQCRKRFLRVSDIMQKAYQHIMGQRTRMIARWFFEEAQKRGIPDARAFAAAQEVYGAFYEDMAVLKNPKLDAKKLATAKDEVLNSKVSKTRKAAVQKLMYYIMESFQKPGYQAQQDWEIATLRFFFRMDQIAHVTASERDALIVLLDKMVVDPDFEIEKADKKALQDPALRLGSVDVAMFGRMHASDHARGVEGSVAVSHSFTVHETAIEEDYMGVVDDLAPAEGSAMLLTQEFSSGVYYGYIVIDVDSLIGNLRGDVNLAHQVIQVFTEAAITVPPTAKINSMAQHSMASWTMVEKGASQPYSLHEAFLVPVSRTNPMHEAIHEAVKLKARFDRKFRKNDRLILDIYDDENPTSLQDVLDFVQE